MDLIGVDRDLAWQAGEIAETHALRGYDAVHLACAVSVGDPALVLVTWDRDLAAAGIEAGLVVIPGR